MIEDEVLAHAWAKDAEQQNQCEFFKFLDLCRYEVSVWSEALLILNSSNRKYALLPAMSADISKMLLQQQDLSACSRRLLVENEVLMHWLKTLINGINASSLTASICVQLCRRPQPTRRWSMFYFLSSVLLVRHSCIFCQKTSSKRFALLLYIHSRFMICLSSVTIIMTILKHYVILSHNYGIYNPAPR